MKYEVKVRGLGGGKIDSLVDIRNDPLYDIHTNLFRQVIDTQDAQIRKALCDLGWKPPSTERRMATKQRRARGDGGDRTMFRRGILIKSCFGRRANDLADHQYRRITQRRGGAPLPYLPYSPINYGRRRKALYDRRKVHGFGLVSTPVDQTERRSSGRSHYVYRSSSDPRIRALERRKTPHQI